MPDRAYDYRFLPSGELEFRGRGRWLIVAGVSLAGIWEWDDRLRELYQLLDTAPDDTTVAEYYQSSDRFAYLVERCLVLNGLTPDDITPHQLEWLLFPRLEGDKLIEPPLVSLNQARSPRYPVGKGGKSMSDRAAFLAAIASSVGSIEEAYAIATSHPAREVMAILEEQAWAGKTGEQKREAEFQDWARQQRERFANGAQKPGASKTPGFSPEQGGDR